MHNKLFSFGLQDDSSTDNSSFDYDLYEKCVKDVSLFLYIFFQLSCCG